MDLSKPLLCRHCGLSSFFTIDPTSNEVVCQTCAVVDPVLSGRRNLAPENRFGGSELERVEEDALSEWNKRDEEFLVSRVGFFASEYPTISGAQPGPGIHRLSISSFLYHASVSFGIAVGSS